MNEYERFFMTRYQLVYVLGQRKRRLYLDQCQGGVQGC